MTDGDKTVLQCAWVYSPGNGPLLRNGAVAFTAGRILDVGGASEIKAAHPDGRVIDAGNALLMPGLINAHTHLELSGCSSLPAIGSFPDWIVSLPNRIGPARDFAAHTRGGIEQCLRFGVTTVGDISQQMHITRPILRASPLRAVSYGEVLGLSEMKRRYEELLPRALDGAEVTERLRVGLSPHSPYTIDLPSFRQCVAIARKEKLRLATHLAELPYEEEFLRAQSGPLRELYERLGRWSDPVETYRDGSPIEFAQAIGLLGVPALLAHVNYCADEGLGLLSRGRASVVYCPRTHRYFGHPPHRFREMLGRGVNVAIGTDSCASSPDLNLMDDLRLVHEIAPEMGVEKLLELVTLNAARALQLQHEVGMLALGYWADFTLFSASSQDPLAEVVESSAFPMEVWIGGCCVRGLGANGR